MKRALADQSPTILNDESVRTSGHRTRSVSNLALELRSRTWPLVRWLPLSQLTPVCTGLHNEWDVLGCKCMDAWAIHLYSTFRLAIVLMRIILPHRPAQSQATNVRVLGRVIRLSCSLRSGELFTAQWKITLTYEHGSQECFHK